MPIDDKENRKVDLGLIITVAVIYFGFSRAQNNMLCLITAPLTRKRIHQIL